MEEIILTDKQIEFLNNKNTITNEFKDWACVFHLERELKTLNSSSYKSLLNKLITKSKSKSKSKSNKTSKYIERSEQEIKNLANEIIKTFYIEDKEKALYIPKEEYKELLIKNIPILSDEECKKYLDKPGYFSEKQIQFQTDLAINKSLQKLPDDLRYAYFNQTIKQSNKNQEKAIIIKNMIENFKKGHYPQPPPTTGRFFEFYREDVFNKFLKSFQEKYFGKTTSHLFINNFTSVTANNFEDLYNLFENIKVEYREENQQKQHLNYTATEQKLLEYLQDLFRITEGIGFHHTIEYNNGFVSEYTGNFNDVIEKLIMNIEDFTDLYINQEYVFPNNNEFKVSNSLIKQRITNKLNKIKTLISNFQNMGLKLNIKYEGIKILIEKFNLYVKQKIKLIKYYIQRVQYNDIEIQRKEGWRVVLQELNNFKLEEKLNETFSKVNLTFKDSKTILKTRTKTTSKASGKTKTKKRKKSH